MAKLNCDELEAAAWTNARSVRLRHAVRRFALLLIPLLGCGGVKVGFEPAPAAGTRAPLAPADVFVHSPGSDDAILPFGVWLDPNDFRAPLRVDPPHEVLGTVTYDRCYLDDALEGVRTEAARRGANAVFDDGNCKGRALAVALSDEATSPDAAILLVEQGAAASEYVVVVEETRSLDLFVPLTVAATRGRCYAVG